MYQKHNRYTLALHKITACSF